MAEDIYKVSVRINGKNQDIDINEFNKKGHNGYAKEYPDAVIRMRNKDNEDFAIPLSEYQTAYDSGLRPYVTRQKVSEPKPVKQVKTSKNANKPVTYKPGEVALQVEKESGLLPVDGDQKNKSEKENPYTSAKPVGGFEGTRLYSYINHDNYGDNKVNDFKRETDELMKVDVSRGYPQAVDLADETMRRTMPVFSNIVSQSIKESKEKAGSEADKELRSSIPTPGSAYLQAMRYNKKVTPSAIFDSIKDKIAKDQNFANMIREESARLEIDPKEYATRYALPTIQKILYNQLIEENVPKSTAEYIFSNAMSGSILGMLVDTASKPLEQRQLESEARGKYNASKAEDVASTVASIAMDLPVMGVTGGLGNAASKTLLRGQINRMMSAGLTREAAEGIATRAAQQTGMKWGLRSVSEGVNFGAYEGLGNVLSQLHTKDEIDASEAGTAMAKGMITGAAMGIFGVGNESIGKALSTKIGDKASQAATYATSLGGRTSILAGSSVLGQWASDPNFNANDINWTDEFIHAGLTNLGFDIIGAAKRIGKSSVKSRDINLTKEDIRQLNEAGINGSNAKEIAESIIGTKEASVLSSFDNKPGLLPKEWSGIQQEYNLSNYGRRFGEIMSNENIDLATKSKIGYLMTGQLYKLSPSTGLSESRDENTGEYIIDTYNTSGQRNERRRFSTADEAAAYKSYAESEVKRNQAEALEDILNAYSKTRASIDVFNSFVDEGISKDRLLDVYSRGKNGEKLSKEDKSLFERINTEIDNSVANDSGYGVLKAKNIIMQAHGLTESEFNKIRRKSYNRMSDAEKQIYNDYLDAMRDVANPSGRQTSYADMSSQSEQARYFLGNDAVEDTNNVNVPDGPSPSLAKPSTQNVNVPDGPIARGKQKALEDYDGGNFNAQNVREYSTHIDMAGQRLARYFNNEQVNDILNMDEGQLSDYISTLPIEQQQAVEDFIEATTQQNELDRLAQEHIDGIVERDNRLAQSMTGEIPGKVILATYDGKDYVVLNGYKNKTGEYMAVPIERGQDGYIDFTSFNPDNVSTVKMPGAKFREFSHDDIYTPEQTEAMERYNNALDGQYNVGDNIRISVDGENILNADVLGIDTTDKGAVRGYVIQVDGENKPVTVKSEEISELTQNAIKADYTKRYAAIDEQLSKIKDQQEKENKGEITIDESTPVQDEQSATETLNNEIIEKAIQEVDEMPFDESGEPVFHSVAPEKTIRFLQEESGFTPLQTKEFINLNISDLSKALSKLEKKKPKVISRYSEYKRNLTEWESEYNDTKKKLDYWTDIKEKMEAQNPASTQPQETNIEDEFKNNIYGQRTITQGSDNQNTGDVAQTVPVQGNESKESGTESGSQTGGDVPERNGQPGNAEYSQENSVPERNEGTEGETIGEQITSAEAEGITLSDELDENGRKFVISGNGSTTFGEIRDGSGLTPAPIKLSEGFNRKDSKGKNHGYGLLHIEASHGDQIRNAGFKSINDFVEYVANGYTIIRNGNKRNSKETYLLELSDGKNNTLFIELSSDGNYWNVNSAGIFRRSYSRKKETVWSLPAVESTSTAEDEGVRNENISSNSMSGNSPQSVSSENKYTNLSQNDNVLEAKIAEEEKKVDLNPTDSQKEAGNYKKGHLKFDGLDFTIENVKGGIRSGKDRDGKEWSVKMNNTYGYIRGTEGVDGDHIDMFISEHPTHGNVYVIDQVNPDGTFDEHKVMYGFSNEDEAKAAYLANYSDGWKGLGNVTEVSREEFKKWIDSSKRKTKPFSEYKSVKPLEQNVSGQSYVNILPKRLREAYESGDKESVDGSEKALIDYIDGSDDLKMIANTYFMSKDLLGKKDILSPSGRKMHDFIAKACKDTLKRRGVPSEVFKSEKYRIDFAGNTDDSVALDIMSDDNSVEVVRAVINNPHTSDETLKYIASRFNNNGLDWETRQILNERNGEKDYQKEDDSIRFRLSDNDLTEEENRIINDSKQNGTFMKAPNGKDTNLTEKQWVQVRTKAFKNWFGDWEKSARIEKLRKSEPVRITGKEIETSNDLKQYKKNALEYGKNLQGSYTNKDTGRSIQLQRGRRNGGLKEVLQHDTNDEAHIRSVAAIPKIIENAIYIDSAENQDKNKNPQVVEYHYYVCGLRIGETDYTVRMVEAEEKDGSRYYDHKLTHIEKGKLIDELARLNFSSSTELSSTPGTGAGDRNRPTNRGEIQAAPISDNKDKRLSSLLQTNASKVVDENGEPLVVYHGTPLSRSQITPNRGWQSDGLTYVRQEAPFNTFKGGEYSGLIFTSVDEDKAMSIAEKRAMSIPDDENGNEQWTEEGYVYSLYLNSRNPFDAQNTAALDKVLSSFNDGNVPTLSFYGGKGDNVSVEEAKKIAESKNNSWIVTETPEFISKVKSLGYDGLKGYDEGVQYIAVTEPLQIKSATENTGEFSSYDSDIRFRFIGEKGASRLDAEEEVTTRLDNLSVARDMERKGKSAKSVKLATGWERGSDGLWRYETLDIEYHPKGDARKGSILKNRPWYDEYMQLVNKILDGEPLTDEEQKRYDGFYEKDKEAREQYDNTEKIYLDDYVKDDELFKAYPELKQTRVVFEWKDGNESGSYSEKENVIRINGNSDIDAESTLVHEIQHSIQRIEGFSTGGNYKSVLNFFADHPEVEMNFVVNETYKEAQRKGIDVSKDELRRMFTESDDVAEGIENDVVERNGITESELGEIYNSGVDAGYRSIAGEVEARNVQSRMGMTMNERLGSLAEETEDVAREDQIMLDRMASHVMSMMDEKVDIEEVNKRFNEELTRFTIDEADNFVFSLGMPSSALLYGGIENKPIKLYGSKVAKKIRKHGFNSGDLKNLPFAVANPIAVFNNTKRPGNRSVLTELKTEKGNILVTLDLGKGMDADFDIVSSVFGKADNSIVHWINKGYATYINKEKALNYLHLSAPIAEASDNQELSSAVKIVKDFENPKVSGVNLRQVDRTASSSYEEMDILDRYMNETRNRILNSPAPVIAESGKDIYAEMPDLSPIQLSRVIVAANNENVRAMYVPYTKQIVLLPKHGTAKEINDAYFHESVHFAIDMILPKGEEGRLTLERAGEEVKELDPRLEKWIEENYNSNKSEEMVAHALENYFSYLDDKGKQDKLKAGVDFGSRYPVMNELSNNIINFLTTEKDGKIQSNGRRIEGNARYDREENQKRSTETDTTALRGEQGEGEIKLAIKGKPRKKAGESEIEFYRRLREWEKQQEEIDKNSGTKAEPTTQYYTTLTEDLRRAQNRINTQNIVINELEKLLKRHEEGKDVREAISSMVKRELSTGTISEFNKRELTSILSQMNKSVTGTKQEATEKAIMAIENIVNEAQARYVQRLIDRMLSLKIQDVNGKNMSIAKNVDDSTRKILSFIKGSASDLRTSGYEDEIRHLRSQNLSSRQDIEALERKIKLSDDEAEKEELQKEIDELNGIISANNEKLEDLNNEIESILKSKAEITDRDIETELDNLYEKMDRAAEGNAVWTISDNERMTSLLLLKQVRDYQKTDSQAVDIEDQIRQEFLNRTELYRKRAKEAYSENRQKLTEAIKNKTIRIRALTESMNALKKQKVDMMVDFSEELKNLISGGQDSLRRQVEAEKERRGMLIVNTLKDITGDKEINIQDNKPRTENWFKKFIFSPIYSFEFLAKMINVNTLGEDGFFYNYFVKGENGVIEAYNTYQRGIEYARDQLDMKCAELFGKNFDKVSGNSDKVVGNSGVYITDYSKNEKYEKPLSKGQAMYIYMVWKMKDGRSKLELQGFTDDSIEDIKSFIGDNYIKLADWIQEELLPELREKYNQRYVEIFNTSLDKVENYVPLRIREEAVRQDVDLTDETKVKNTLEHKARSLIRRVVNVKPVDITLSAFDVIMGHLNEMEEWYAYARVRKDLESVLSNNRIRNQINTNMHGMFNNLKEAAAVATRSHTPKTGGFLDVALGKLSKGIIGGNIAFRVSTALKQVLSAPAFFGYSQSPLFIKELVKSMSHPVNTYKWALENLPSFRERLRQNNAGNEKLNDDDKLAKWMEKYIEVGMWPNKMIDAITCAIGAKAIYEYKLKRLTDSGMTREEAERKAKMEADIDYNGTQQSSHPSFLSPMQMSRSAVDRLMTTYQNSNIGYVRKVVSAYMDLKKSMDYKRLLNEYKRKYIDEGMTPEDAEIKAKERIYNANKKYITGILLFGWGLNKLWEIGSLGLLGFIHSDDGDTREKNPLAKSITTYITSPLKGLPFTNVAENFIQGRDINPVFVFNELNDFKDEAKEIAEMYGVLSPELAYSILERGSTLSGVDLETWANVYTGVEDLVKNGATWDNALIDIMYVANFPRSNRLQVARELYKNADKEQYLERVSHAGNYIVPSAKLRTYIPGAIELSTTKAKDLEKQYELLNMTEEEREKYHALQTLTKVVLDDKELNKEWDDNKDAETRREIAQKMYKNYSDEKKNRSIETLIGASSIVYVGPVSDKEESRYLELSSYDDIMNDIRLKGYIADKKEFSDKYNQLLKDGKKDEAEQYYKDNSDNIRLYKAAFKYGQRINKLKKSLNKGNDNDVIDEIRRTRNSFFEEFK